jgi:two-component system response regulator YesN
MKIQSANTSLQGTVLVVDDDPAQRREIVTCLDDLGINTAQAEDGLSAIEMARTLRPNVIIMDIRMPRMDGIEAVQAMGTMSPTKIILVTGDPSSLYRAKTSSLDVFAVIEKPIPLRSLSRFVLKALGRDVC